VGFGHATLDVDVAGRDGTELAAGQASLVAWYTPGHASDHLCYFAPASGTLFTGDHVMQGSTVVIRPPDGDLTEYLDSLARVRDDVRVLRIAPGHGRMLADPAAAVQEVIDHRLARGRIVLDALQAHGPGTAASLRPFAYPDVRSDRDVVASATCWAHLLALVTDELATTSSVRTDPDAVFSAR
jgi:glyoxylase-like metal-dependent hydrolase (beta-lactamase superfamily II)